MTENSKRICVTGGAGFIGVNLIRHLLEKTDDVILNIDKLVFAGSVHTVETIGDTARHQFRKICLTDRQALSECINDFRPDAVMHLAAESHVDRSIDSPEPFITSNIQGTYTLLEVTRTYWRTLPPSQRDRFRFLHVSTDEVFGSLTAEAPPFNEDSPYRPSSPYAASKAASDHLVQAWNKTYSLPTLLTNCSNNYGPYQFPEKLIPLMISKALVGEELPIYGDGSNVRDWLYVGDHVTALHRVLRKGRPGRRYNIGGHSELSNIEVVNRICDILDELRPDAKIGPRRRLTRFVTDRPGHDFRYATDTGRIENELGWSPATRYTSGLRATVEWYLNNAEWCRRVAANTDAGRRLGLIGS